MRDKFKNSYLLEPGPTTATLVHVIKISDRSKMKCLELAGVCLQVNIYYVRC